VQDHAEQGGECRDHFFWGGRVEFRAEQAWLT
jgi:hypothetical protein